MSHHWQKRLESGGGGILRKNHSQYTETKPIDLLVFGYACKVFRDDDKARNIDQGKHLIPWNGDDSLKIDRYDVRAHLYDLNPYEPPSGGYQNRMDYLSPEEQRAEQLCEAERYRSLYHNEEEEKLYQEEELKRLQADTAGTGYSQIGFSYDGGQNENSQSSDGDSRGDEADSAFVAPKNFSIPADIEVPETMKQHAIIERTAKFIAREGIQMEIFMKAKQANNSQFEFLTVNNPLNSYYKHVMESFKNGSYPEVEDENSKDTTDESKALSEKNDSQDVAIFPVKHTPIVPIKYTPSADCSYTQLISKIKGVPLPPAEQPSESKDKNFTPVLLQYNSLMGQNENENSNPATSETSKVPSNALLLAQYYTSGSEDEEEEEPTPILDFPQPAEDLRNIIDKTASYVIKNGRQFEETLRMKNAERFSFLYADDEFYSYYMYKVTGVAKNFLKLKKNGSTDSKTILPVSFSIKQKEEGNQAVIRPALPQEGSDDDNKGDANSKLVPARRLPEHVQKVIQLVEKQLQARNVQQNTTTSISEETSEVLQQKEMKMARDKEEKIKDKLAQIAREKLGGLLSKEKQLQLERKKKAQAFLDQIKANTAKATEDLLEAPPPPIISDVIPIHTIDSDSDYSIHSIPISGYGDKSEEDDVELIIEPKRRSRSRSRSHPKSYSKSRSQSKSRHKSKKKSSRHSKKKSKKRSRSSSSSYSRSPSRTRKYSSSPERKRKKRSSSRKDKKRRRDDR